MTTKKQLPDNWWDYGINPIVGFKIPKVGDKKVHKRNTANLYKFQKFCKKRIFYKKTWGTHNEWILGGPIR